jgi:exodeoxyribonuclease-3
VGWRIDFFLVTQNLIPRISDAEIYDQIMGSDHCPIGLTID